MRDLSFGTNDPNHNGDYAAQQLRPAAAVAHEVSGGPKGPRGVGSRGNVNDAGRPHGPFERISGSICRGGMFNTGVLNQQRAAR